MAVRCFGCKSLIKGEKYVGNCCHAASSLACTTAYLRARLTFEHYAALLHLSAIISPMGIAEVAAGEGALQTWSMRSVCTNRKS